MRSFKTHHFNRQLSSIRQLDKRLIESTSQRIVIKVARGACVLVSYPAKGSKTEYSFDR